MANSTNMNNMETSMCKICENDPARYCCPKCNILYCSISCYQANPHLQCSECFYKENILEELKLNKDDSEKAEAQICKMLQRTQDSISGSGTENSFSEENKDSELDSDDENYQDITERLAGVNLDDADKVWEKLTQDEKQEFVAFLRSGDVTKLIPPWQPWWLHHKEDVVEDLESSEKYKKNCPNVCSIKDISQITTKTPSECVKYNLINIISAYAFTTRYFNGEHFDFTKEAVSCIASLSLTLKDAVNYDDFDTAVTSVEQECINSSWIDADEDNFSNLRQDISKILKGPTKFENKFYLLCALSDFRNLLMQSLEPPNGDKTFLNDSKLPNAYVPSVEIATHKNIKMWIKKVEYFLAFTKDCYVNVC